MTNGGHYSWNSTNAFFPLVIHMLFDTFFGDYKNRQRLLRNNSVFRTWRWAYRYFRTNLPNHTMVYGLWVSLPEMIQIQIIISCHLLSSENYVRVFWYEFLEFQPKFWVTRIDQELNRLKIIPWNVNFNLLTSWSLECQNTFFTFIRQCNNGVKSVTFWSSTVNEAFHINWKCFPFAIEIK